MAQKKELSQARSFLKSRNYDKAEKTITDLLQKDTASRHDKRACQYWFEAVRGQYDQANERMYLKQKQDTAAFFTLCSRLFAVAQKLDSIDMRPDKKGRVAPEYREKHAELLHAYRTNLYGGGTYHIRKGNYKQAFTFFEAYIDCARQPLFSAYHYDSTDARMPEAGYWATYSAYKQNDAVLTLRHRRLALRDTAKQQFALQYVAEARRWMKDEELYIKTLEEGFAHYPASPYFFPRLYDAYTRHGWADKALALTDKALAANDKSELYLFAKSTTLLQLERYGESAKVSEQLIGINDKLPEACYNAGIAYLNIALKLDPLKDKKQTASLYQKARAHMEHYRQLAPNEKEKWGQPLYRIYYNLNMGKQFDEIDKLLKK